MITWMQRQKKYLIVILWVTVISFVGAGFVGWGSYSYGDKASNVAKVGEVEITVGEFQRQYSNIFGYYNQMLEGKVSEAQKKDFQQVALNNLINRALLLNYAKELGISASPQEIANEIGQTPSFQNKGKFDKEVYIAALNNARLKIADYEHQVKQDITIGKLNDLFNFPATQLELAAFSAPITMKDKLEYKVLRASDINPTVTEEQKKKFYEENKANFMSNPAFDISYVKVTKENLKITEVLAKEHHEKNKTAYLDDKGNVKSFEEAKSDVLEDLADKISRKETLKRSVAWKKGEVEPISIKAVPMHNQIIPFEALKAADEKADTKRSKPVKIKDGYIVFKIDKRVPPRQLTYDESKQFLELVVKQQVARSELEKVAEKVKKNLQGKVTDFIGISDGAKLTELTSEEANQFLSSLLTSDERVGVINLGEKAVVYKILEQKLFEEKINSADSDFAKETVERVKTDSVMQDLISELKNRYKIETFIESL